MALFGLQLVLTGASAFVVVRARNLVNCAHWLLQGLRYYQLPTQDVIKKHFQTLNVHKVSDKVRQRTKEEPPVENTGATSEEQKLLFMEKNDLTKMTFGFSVIKSPLPAVEGTLEHFHSFVLLEAALFIAILMVIEFVASQAYFLFAKPTIVEVNMFGVWALVGTVVTASLLLQLITSYSFKSAEFQYSMLSFMLFAAIALVSAGPADSLLLDFNLASSFVTFRELVLTSLESNNMSDLKYVVNRLTESNTTLIWVVLAAFLGSITVYPAIRFGVLYAESADEHKDSLSKSLLLHASFVLPIIAPLLWVLPITRKFDLSFQFLTWLRVAACLIVVLSRFAVVRTVVQTYLDSVGSTIKKISGEEGRLTLFDFRLKIWPIVFYVCVVTLQLVGPVLLLLYATLLMASWGDIGFYHSNTPGIVFSGQMLLPVFSFFTWFLVTVQALGSTLAVLSQRLGQQFR